MDGFGERLKEERLRLNLSQTELGELAGVTKNTQRLYEIEQRIPKADYLLALQKVGISIQYLLSGADNLSHAHSDPYESHEGFISMPDEAGYSRIAIYDIEAAAGTGTLFDAENVETSVYFDTEQLEREGLDPAQLVGVRVRGDSMDETLREGDRVLVDRSSRTPDGVFLLRMDDGLRIKRVQRVAGGAWMLHSDNSLYQSEMIKPQDMGQIEIIGECRIRIGRIA